MSLYGCGIGKRLGDIVISSVLLCLLSPVMFIVAVLLLFNGFGQVLFRQKRPGKNGRLFALMKFKTMKDTRDEHGQLLPDVYRLTTLGRFLRITSLDELPQLFNVLKGEMSLIGPRPLLEEYLALYNERQHMRHNVKPGITGWAQVNGRNAISWEQKFELDVWYVEHCSFLLDMRILFKTIITLISPKGVNELGQATAKKFTGN
jgi:lipopolysaccharide/colanic/teichoic acid biosynthesis glycosyltransferase